MKNIIIDKVIEILDKSPFIKNLARKRFFVDFLAGMITGRKVQFQEIALHMGSEAKTESAERRIQAFFQGYDFDYAQACALLALFLPKGKIGLSIDRTGWGFGKYRCNILTIVAKNGPSEIPLYRGPRQQTGQQQFGSQGLPAREADPRLGGKARRPRGGGQGGYRG